MSCVIVVLALYQLPLEKKNIEYPLTEPVEEYDIYVQQFDAWMKGQANLDLNPDIYLKEIKNPYDKTERTYVDEHGEYLHTYTGLDVQLPYWWDHAYYNGKFYCYFGPAVLLTFYFPFYFLTGKLPSNFWLRQSLRWESASLQRLLTVRQCGACSAGFIHCCMGLDIWR